MNWQRLLSNPTSATSAPFHRQRLAILKDILTHTGEKLNKCNQCAHSLQLRYGVLKHTVVRSQTSVISASIQPRKQVIWKATWERTVERSPSNVTSVRQLFIHSSMPPQKTCEGAQRKEARQVWPVQLFNLTSRPSENSHVWERTVVRNWTNVIWRSEDQNKCAVARSPTSVASAIIHPLKQAIWEVI